MQPAEDQSHPSALPLICALALITGGLVWYALTAAFAWDEGFHLLTAQLISHGRIPYLDFCFSQTPLNAWWNAAWMSLFGESWRVTHVAAALCSSAAVALTTVYVFTRFPQPNWRRPGALLSAVLAGLNLLVFRFGGIGQAYGFCLLTVMAAFWFCILSVDRKNPAFALLSGLFCGLGAAASLLSAAAGPVLLLWMLYYERAGRKLLKAGAFLLGGVLACIPILRLWVQGPRQVIFGIINYNLLYRQADWPDANQQNLEVLLGWINSGQAVLLVLLALGGLLFVRYESRWEAKTKAEFYLCGWLSLAFLLYITSVRPTFPRYYVFAVPFLSIPAVAGVSSAAAKLYRPDRQWLPVLVVGGLTALGLAQALYDEREATTWPNMENVARKVTDVTAPGDTLFADEETYFLTRHTPPRGMEMQNSHKFTFSAADNALFHVIPQAELDRMVQTGYFHTLETCEDAERQKNHNYGKLYRKSVETEGCTVFWDWKR